MSDTNPTRSSPSTAFLLCLQAPRLSRRGIRNSPLTTYSNWFSPLQLQTNFMVVSKKRPFSDVCGPPVGPHASAASFFHCGTVLATTVVDMVQASATLRTSCHSNHACSRSTFWYHSNNHVLWRYHLLRLPGVRALNRVKALWAGRGLPIIGVCFTSLASYYYYINYAAYVWLLVANFAVNVPTTSP